MWCFWKPDRPCLFFMHPAIAKNLRPSVHAISGLFRRNQFIYAIDLRNPEWHIGFFLRSITTKMASSLLAIHLENCQHIPTKKLIIRSVKHAISLNSIIEELHPYEKGFVIKTTCSVRVTCFFYIDEYTDMFSYFSFHYFL